MKDYVDAGVRFIKPPVTCDARTVQSLLRRGLLVEVSGGLRIEVSAFRAVEKFNRRVKRQDADD